MGTLGPRGQADDVVVGSVFAWILGLGVLFLTIYTTSKSTADATAGVSVLFGSIFGLSHESGGRGHRHRARRGGGRGGHRPAPVVRQPRSRVWPRPVVSPWCCSASGSSPWSARVPPRRPKPSARCCSSGCWPRPAGTAQQLTARPYRALALSCGVAVGDMWAGLTLSYAFPHLPPSFCVIAVAAGVYLVVLAATRVRRRVPARV